MISNQVLEHVSDAQKFFTEIHRVLNIGGIGIHLFPLSNYIYEGHLLLPFVHKIRSHDFMCSYISLMSSLGFGKFKQHNRETGISLNEFSEKHADYIYFFTRYLSEGEIVRIVKESGLRSSYRFSIEFYSGKLRSIIGLAPRLTYRNKGRAFFDATVVKFLRYLSVVTLVCEKRQTYS